MSTIYTNISEHRKKAEEQLLADYPMVASLYEIMDAYFTCVMVRLKNVKIKDQNNEGYKLKLLLSFMRSNFSLSDLVKGSEHIDAYTLLRKQLELLARFTELNTKTKEELEKSKKTPNVSNVVGMQSFYGYLSNIAHSTSYMILSDIFAYEKQIERKVGLSMQPQYNEFTIDTLCLQCELFIRFATEMLDFQSVHVADYDPEQDIMILTRFLQVGVESKLEFFDRFREWLGY